MKRLLLWATWLYPPHWRARYRGEMEALIEDSGRAGWRELIDLLKGAIVMNFKERPPAKVMGGFTLAGLMIAGVVWTVMPAWYQSSGTVQSDATPKVVNKVVGEMRNDLPDEDWRRIIVRKVDSGRFSIAVQDRSPAVAQAKTEAMQRNIIEGIKRAGGSATVADAAGSARVQRQELPLLVALGCVVGLLCGGIIVLLKRSTFRVIGAFVLAGTAIGGLTAAAIPSLYRSTASFEVAGAADAGAVVQTALGAANAGGRGIVRISNVESVHVSPGETIRAFSLSVDDRDPSAAVSAVVDLERRIGQRLREQGVSAEVLDGASLPQWPIYPNRTAMTATGAAGGLILGAVVMLWRRRVA